MIPGLPCLHVARVTIEAATALSVTTGLGASLYDTALVRDANGLPALPGTSIAGVLRSLYRSMHGRSSEESLFGHAEREREQPSHLQVSWGCFHDQNDQPVEGLLLGGSRSKLADDALLAWAHQDQPMTRDHVRLNDRGTAEHGGKFDRAVLPAGYRFTFELSLWSAALDDWRFERVLCLISHPGFRLGGATRRGLGRLKPVRIKATSFDLREPADRNRFKALPIGLGDTPATLNGGTGFADVALEPTVGSAPAVGQWVRGDLTLNLTDFFRMGQGLPAETSYTKRGEPADLLPVREACVQWSPGRNGVLTGTIGCRRLVVAASGVKGALRHRTIFHVNRLNGDFIDPDADEKSSTDRPQHLRAGGPCVESLFGTAKADRSDDDDQIGGSEPKGHVGRLVIDDAWPESGTSAIMPHNSIDRFTGGVRRGFLFTEELAHKGSIALILHLFQPDSIRGVAKRAFVLALKDLTESRLAIGAGGAKGHGYCTGTINWSDGGAWIEGGT